MDVIGYLEPMPTVTGYAVTAVIGLVDMPDALNIDHNEVEFVFEVPLEFLLDKRNATASERDFRGRKIAIVEFRFEEHIIWGATAYMLIDLGNKIRKTK